MATGVEGHSTNRPPLFDGSNYQFWSNRMSIFMRSYNYEMWDVVLDAPYVPMTTRMGSEALEPKLQSEWSKTVVKKVQVNFKAINTLCCALNPTKFNRISTCTHEGTSQVKESKIALLSNQYEMFKMQPNENITSWFEIGRAHV